MARVVRRGQKLGAFVDDNLLDVNVDQHTRIVKGLKQHPPTLRRKSFGERMFPHLQDASTTDGDEAGNADAYEDIALPGQIGSPSQSRNGSRKASTAPRRAYEATLLATELAAETLKPTGTTMTKLPGE